MSRWGGSGALWVGWEGLGGGTLVPRLTPVPGLSPLPSSLSNLSVFEASSAIPSSRKPPWISPLSPSLDFSYETWCFQPPPLNPDLSESHGRSHVGFISVISAPPMGASAEWSLVGSWPPGIALLLPPGPFHASSHAVLTTILRGGYHCSFPFYRCRSRASRKLSNSPWVTQPASGRARIQTWVGLCLQGVSGVNLPSPCYIFRKC